MGKKPRAKKLNAATDTAKNPDSTPKTPNNGSNPREPEPVVSQKPSKDKSNYVRRSGRLQSVIKPVQNQEVEEIDLVESEREEDEPQFEENMELMLPEPRNDDSRNEPRNDDLLNGPRNDESHNGPTTNQKSLDEKAIKTVEVLKSKVGAQGNGSCESTSVSLIYKSLYLDSQKKIEALTSENHELARKLEIVLGKLEVYENVNKSQMVIISNMEKAIEGLVRPTSLVGRFSSLDKDAGGGSNGGGRVVPKELSTKKRRQDQKSN